jgi:hypothetical protein
MYIYKYIGIPLVTILAELKKGVKTQHLSSLSAHGPSPVETEEFDVEGRGEENVDKDSWFDIEGGVEGGGLSDVQEGGMYTHENIYVYMHYILYILYIYMYIQ